MPLSSSCSTRCPPSSRFDPSRCGRTATFTAQKRLPGLPCSPLTLNYSRLRTFTTAPIPTNPSQRGAPRDLSHYRTFLQICWLEYPSRPFADFSFATTRSRWRGRRDLRSRRITRWASSSNSSELERSLTRCDLPPYTRACSRSVQRWLALQPRRRRRATSQCVFFRFRRLLWLPQACQEVGCRSLVIVSEMVTLAFQYSLFPDSFLSFPHPSLQRSSLPPSVPLVSRYLV
jgi:hypothetical protein